MFMLALSILLILDFMIVTNEYEDTNEESYNFCKVRDYTMDLNYGQIPGINLCMTSDDKSSSIIVNFNPITTEGLEFRLTLYSNSEDLINLIRQGRLFFGIDPHQPQIEDALIRFASPSQSNDTSSKVSLSYLQETDDTRTYGDIIVCRLGLSSYRCFDSYKLLVAGQTFHYQLNTGSVKSK